MGKPSRRRKRLQRFSPPQTLPTTHLPLPKTHLHPQPTFLFECSCHSKASLFSGANVAPALPTSPVRFLLSPPIKEKYTTQEFFPFQFYFKVLKLQPQ